MAKGFDFLSWLGLRERPPWVDAGGLVRWERMDDAFQAVCAVWADGRCLIADGYAMDAHVRTVLGALRATGIVPDRLREQTVPLERIAEAWGRGRGEGLLEIADPRTVDRVEADRLEVANDVAVGGDFRIGGEFAIGRALRMEGTFSAPDGVTFTGDAEFTGRVNANEVSVTAGLEAASAAIGQDVTAGSVAAGGNVTATGVTSRSSLTAASGYIRTLSVGSCSGC